MLSDKGPVFGDRSIEKFSVNVDKVRAFAEMLGRQFEELPDSRAVTGQPTFGHAMHPGMFRLAGSYAGATRFLEQLADQIRGGTQAGQQAASKAVDNYVNADARASARAQAMQRGLEGFEPDDHGPPGQGAIPGRSGQPGAASTPGTSPQPSSGVPDQEGKDLFGPYLNQP